MNQRGRRKRADPSFFAGRIYKLACGNECSDISGFLPKMAFFLQFSSKCENSFIFGEVFEELRREKTNYT
jgi:hypothetical protein